MPETIETRVGHTGGRIGRRGYTIGAEAPNHYPDAREPYLPSLRLDLAAVALSCRLGSPTTSLPHLYTYGHLDC